MEEYTEVTIPLLDDIKDIVNAELINLGYEGTWDKGNELVAYIQTAQFEHKKLYDMLGKYSRENSFSYTRIENKNWNEEWEKNYDPIWIDDRVYVRSPFHKGNKEVKHEIVIQPKMSFGTGHHETTQLMMEMMLTSDLQNKLVLDMGTGTGVLSFFASQLGADSVIGIDIDQNSVENARDNVKYNKCTNVSFLNGSEEAIPSQKFDVVLSNITKNINMGLLPHLAKHVSNNGLLILAGFLNFDLKEIDNLVSGLGFKVTRSNSKGDWECLLYTKMS